jgi:hypothetical protein
MPPESAAQDLPVRSPRLAYDEARLAAACRALGLTMLVAYGSRAGGAMEPAPDSDLDLALHGPGLSGWTGLSACLDALGDVFGGYILDVVFLGEADPLFRWEIMREGRLLFGDPIRFLEYRAFAYKDFIDSADLRRLEAALFRKRMDWIREQLHVAA